MGGFMNYAIEIGSVAKIYIPSFVKIGSGIQKLISGRFSDIQTGWRLHKPTWGRSQDSLVGVARG
jgi:hypothetical protein